MNQIEIFELLEFLWASSVLLTSVDEFQFVAKKLA